MSNEELSQQGLDPKPAYGSSSPRGEQNTPPVFYTPNLGDCHINSLEVVNSDSLVALRPFQPTSVKYTTTRGTIHA